MNRGKKSNSAEHFDPATESKMSPKTATLSDIRIMWRIWGKHVDFFDKVIEVLPTQSPLVFICDGAKWIWKWIEEYYPNSTQILDLYHCKEHLYAFAKIYYPKDEHQSRKWVESCIELLNEQKG